MKEAVVNQAIARVAKILWEDWDPIGVNAVVPHGTKTDDAWTDEYDSYAPKIAGMLLQGESTETVSRHLNTIAENSMGLRPARAHDLEIAKRLEKIINAEAL